ncbi:MAG TPA: PDZ domain-containing protein [Longimicrobiaceae bacterium]|nr:PDZ domain-containing protein [Longimicrobiaceae bacterium]
MRAATLLLSLALLPAPALAQAPVEYDISFPNAVHHEAEVRVTFPDAPVGKPLDVWMSRSSPGRYALHEFAKNVYSVKAFDGEGNELGFSRPDPYRWRVVPDADGTVTLTYTVFGDRADGTYAGFDATHAHMNMPAVFMWAEGMEQRPIRITFHPLKPGWKVATQLAPTDDPYVFTAPDLQYFMDSPTEVSDHRLFTWQEPSTGGAETMRISLHSQATDAEARQYAESVKKIVAEEKAVYGELPRYDFGTYTFLADYLPWTPGDGMEHRNSTLITSTRPLSTGMLANLGTVAHEYFHSWNMERIRSAQIEPFDFTRANMSDALWFGEGFTQYYTDVPLVRAGLLSIEDYAGDLGRVLNTVVNSPGRQYFTPVEMSQQAPFVDAATSIDPNNKGNTFISYYTWGNALGLGLDLALRERYDLTLDGFMRAMWNRYGQYQENHDPQRPYTVDDIRNTLGEFTRDTAFANDYFRRYVQGHEVMDYATLLEPAGLVLRQANPAEPWAGYVRMDERDGQVVLVGATHVGTPLYEAGLERGDVIVSVDGRPVSTAAEVEAAFGAHRPGDQVKVEFEQRAGRRTATVTLVPDPTLEVVTFEQAGRSVTPAIERFRESWLGSHAN